MGALLSRHCLLLIEAASFIPGSAFGTCTSCFLLYWNSLSTSTVDDWATQQWGSAVKRTIEELAGDVREQEEAAHDAGAIDIQVEVSIESEAMRVISASTSRLIWVEFAAFSNRSNFHGQVSHQYGTSSKTSPEQ
jgi:hypothetical protein